MRVHHAARNLQLHRVRAVAELFDHHQLLIGRDGDDIHPVDAVENDEVVFFASARRNFFVRPHRENAEVADGRGTDFLPGLDHVARGGGGGGGGGEGGEG